MLSRHLFPYGRTQAFELECKDLGNVKSKSSLRRLVSKYSPNVICLQDTKLRTVTNQFLRDVSQDVKFRGVFMGSRGLSGGIMTLWEDNVFHLIKCEINE